MSPFGTSRTWCDVRVESAMRRITDIGEQPPARAISRGTLADAARNRLMTSPILEARRRLPAGGDPPRAPARASPRNGHHRQRLVGLSWRRYRDFPPLENGSLFAVPNLDDVKVESRNREAIKHGLEPIDPS